MHNFTAYHFDGQKEGEEILLVAHRHWFNIAVQFVPIFCMLIVLFILNLSLPMLLPAIQTNYADLYNFMITFFLMLLWIFSFLIWIDYYFDVWIITDRRIVNVEQKALFSREVSELEHIRVQDVTTDVKGFFPTLFNYGDVLIQTAGERDRFDFECVPDPYAIKDLVMKMQKKQETEETNDLGEMIHKKIEGITT